MKLFTKIIQLIYHFILQIVMGLSSISYVKALFTPILQICPISFRFIRYVKYFLKMRKDLDCFLTQYLIESFQYYF